uniref:Uncharacterized protein n=1 Tax=Candidatus Nitrotoga fabula TaxID=2182327 RepID=A0A2X0QU60_9PROT|nr:protein of unknown function [Candidatus Nitrotoga fabula]
MQPTASIIYAVHKQSSLKVTASKLKLSTVHSG